MESMVYKSQGYYIDASNNSIPTVNGKNLLSTIIMHYFDKDGVLSKYIDCDENKEIAKHHLQFLHEVTHYYQDLAMPAAICEKMLKTRMGFYAVEELTGGIKHFPLFDQVEKNFFRYLGDGMMMEKGIAPGWYSSQDLSKIGDYQYIYNRLFRTAFFSDYEFNLTYEDLLESHAEIKSLNDFFNEARDEKTSSFIHSLISELEKFPITYIDNHDGTFTFKYRNIDNKYERKYNIVRSIFISYIFSPNIGTDSRDYFSLKRNFGPLLRFYINYIPVHPEHELNYVMDYAAWIDWFILLAIELSMTIPAPSYYIENILNRDDYDTEIYKYIPPHRFFKVLEIFEQNQDYWWNNDTLLERSYSEVYDYVASLCGWCSFDEIKRSYELEPSLEKQWRPSVFSDLNLRWMIGKGMSKVGFINEPSISILRTSRAPIIVKTRQQSRIRTGFYNHTTYAESYHQHLLFIVPKGDTEFNEYNTPESVLDIITAIQKRLITTGDFYSGDFIMNSFDSAFLQYCRNDFFSFLLVRKKKDKCTCPLYDACPGANPLCKEIVSGDDIRECYRHNPHTTIPRLLLMFCKDI